MRRSARIAGFALLLTAAVSPVAAEVITARLPDGRTLAFRCEGKGAPTLLFESGWAADSKAWNRVIPLLAGTTRLCAYDRAGSGESDAGPLPRDGTAIAKDLDEGLRAAGIKGPFVLVGHSAGGLYARHFALRRPADMAGLVLADSSVPHQQQRFEAAFGPGAGSLDGIIERARQCVTALSAADSGAAPISARCRITPPSAALGRWTARLSELETLAGSTSAGLDGGEPHLSHLPIIMLTAGKGFPPPVADVWAGFHREIAALSACGKARVVRDSGHMMIFDRPDAIAGAVREVLALHAAAHASGKRCTGGPT